MWRKSTVSIFQPRAYNVQQWTILVGCAQTAAVLDESMIGGMGDCWDFIIGWFID
mgnify:FL=1